jgi:hypothetical protein
MDNTTDDCDVEDAIPLTCEDDSHSINGNAMNITNNESLVPSATNRDPLVQESNDPSTPDRRKRNEATVSLERHPSVSTDGGLVTEDEPESLIDNETTKREGQRVTCLKLLVILILVSSATIIAVIVYLYITNSEEKQFLAKFQNDADKILESIGSSFERTLGTMNALAVILVSNAHDQGHPWPFVTLPDFALHASKLIPLTDGLFLSVLPIVTPSEKQKWEEYALQKDYWVNESLALQTVWDGYYGNITYDWTRSDTIYGDFGAIDDNVRYAIQNVNCCLADTLTETHFVFFLVFLVDTCYHNGKCSLWLQRHVNRIFSQLVRLLYCANTTS